MYGLRFHDDLKFCNSVGKHCQNYCQKLKLDFYLVCEISLCTYDNFKKCTLTQFRVRIKMWQILDFCK